MSLDRTETAVRSAIDRSITAKRRLDRLAPAIADVAERLRVALDAGGKLLIFGNGGSASDAQHIAAELVGRYVVERPGMPAIALNTDTSALTAISNDYGYDRVFARQIEALGRAGDVVIGISTSGNSPNVVAALETARDLGMATIALTGGRPSRCDDIADLVLSVPAVETARVQECHILIGHAVCEALDLDHTASDAPTETRAHDGVTADLLALRDTWRAERATVVLTNGCFDLLHPGHLSALEAARAEGDVLVVALNSDRSVRALKGDDRPLFAAADRARLLLGLSVVDHVVHFDDDDAERGRRQPPARRLEQGRRLRRSRSCDHPRGRRGELLRRTGQLRAVRARALVEHAPGTSAPRWSVVTGRRALFLDRDGTIIEDTGFVADPSEVRLLPHASSGIGRVIELGFVPVVVSNQSGVGRGYFDQAAVGRVDEEMRRQLAATGVELATPSFYCFHAPDEGCSCRKPASGLLLAAVDELGLDAPSSAVTGDRARDVQAGLAIGCAAYAIGFAEPGATTVAHLDDGRRRVGKVDDRCLTWARSSPAQRRCGSPSSATSCSTGTRGVGWTGSRPRRRSPWSRSATARCRLAVRPTPPSARTRSGRR